MTQSKKYKIIELGILILLIVLFIFFIVERETFLRKFVQSELDYQAQIIENDLWNYDKEGALNYMKLSARIHNYELLDVYDYNNKLFIHVQGSTGNIIDKYLFKIGLIENIRLKSTIFYHGENIGRIDVIYRHDSIYLYLNLLIIIAFIQITVKLFIHNLYARNLLEIELKERKKLEDKLKFQAMHDSLTGLYNRNIFEQKIADEINRAIRYHHPLSIFMVDIDYFKNINDTYGHQVGDDILKDLAILFNKSIRNSDYIARYGGEEFVVILPETSESKAIELAERLRIQVLEHVFLINDKQPLNLTISIGTATYPENANSWTDLVGMADSAMYTAKKSGRNQIISAMKK